VEATLSTRIPNYNHGHLLERAVAAVFAQERLPDEVVIYDDGSTVLLFLIHASHSLDLLVACLTRGFNSRGSSILRLIATRTGRHAR